jgi:hypothetical protein
VAEQQELITIESRIESEPTEDNQDPVTVRPRLKVINRNQLVMRTLDLEKSIPEDHPTRAIWAMVQRLDMTAFEARIKAVEGRAGQSTLDPRILAAL